MRWSTTTTTTTQAYFHPKSSNGRARCYCCYSYSHEDAGVAVVRQQGVLAAARLRVLDVGPAAHEVAVGHDARELARDGAVDGLCDAEVGGEEDVKVPLVDLRGAVSIDHRP